MNTNPNLQNLIAGRDRIQKAVDTLASIDVGGGRTAGDPGFYIDAGRAELLARRAEQDKLIAQARDEGEGSGESQLRLNAAHADLDALNKAANDAVEFAINGEPDPAECLRLRDAIFLAGQRVNALRALNNRQLRNLHAADHGNRWPKLREKMAEAERCTIAVARALIENASDDVARALASKSALTVAKPLDVALLLLAEPAAIAALEQHNAEAAKVKKSSFSNANNERVIDVAKLKSIFGQRFNAAAALVQKDGAQARADLLAQENVRLSRELEAAKAAPPVASKKKAAEVSA